MKCLPDIAGPLAWLPSASEMAPRVDSLLAGLLIAASAVVLLLTAVTLVILVRFRRGTDASRAPLRIATWKIETAWTVATLAIFLFFFARGTTAYLAIEHVPPGAQEIDVVGRQWMWDVRHPDGRREFNELHVRIHAPVRLVLSSEDVIHSFFVPAFRLKQDLVPGKYVDAWFNPTRAGTYTLFCAQYCGTAHAEMTGRIIVMEPADFAAWQAAGRPASPTAGSATARGSSLYATFGCAQCHERGGPGRAPSLAGLYGNLVRLEGGALVRADDQFLHDAILKGAPLPAAGYPRDMPTYRGILGESQVRELVEYLKTLRPPQPLASNP